MIVHLFEDEKFVDITIENFEGISNGENRYIVFSDSIKLTYVKNIKKVEIVNNSFKNIDIPSIFKNCDLLIIHKLSPIKLYVLKHIPNRVTAIWSVWGADAYSYFNKNIIYEPITKSTKRRNVIEIFRSSFLYNIYHFYMYRVFPINKEIVTLNRFDYLITVLPDEYALIKNEFKMRAKYIDYNYGINKFNQEGYPTLGDSVLLGNSIDYSNNHLDAFNLIKEIKKSLIVPLSYAGNNNYRDIVIQKGTERFKTLFNPIVEFLPIKKYNKLITSCNTVIMYHIRQQALGTIFMSLYLGMRVFLNKKSLTSKYMNDIGMIVFDLHRDNNLIGIELTLEQKKHNRKLVIALRGREVINEKISSIVSLYNSLIKSN